jgi:hypothetical protein
MKPNEFIGFLFKKIETGYFCAIAGTVAAGNLMYLLTWKAENGKGHQYPLVRSGFIFSSGVCTYFK